MTSTEHADKVNSLKLIAAQYIAKHQAGYDLTQLPTDVIDFFTRVKYAEQNAEFHKAETARLKDQAFEIAQSWTQVQEPDANWLDQQTELTSDLLGQMREMLEQVSSQAKWLTECGGSLHETLYPLYYELESVLEGSIATVGSVSDDRLR